MAKQPITYNHFAKESSFDAQKATIKDESLSFIQDSRKIHTHGAMYKSFTWGKVSSPRGDIELTYYHGIESIEVNGKNYYPDYSQASKIDVIQPGSINYTTVTYDPPVFLIRAKAGQVDWKINFKDGYKQASGSASGSGNLAENGKLSVNIPTTYISVPIRVVKNPGVASITVNTSNGTSTSTTNTDWGTLVTWTAVLTAGYDVETGVLSGSFIATDPDGYDIGADLTTKIQSCPIRLQFNPGIESITVDGIEHKAEELESENSLIFVEVNPRVDNINITYDPMEKIIYTDYNTARSWSAKAKEGWTISQANGSVNATGTINNVSPTATLNS